MPEQPPKFLFDENLAARLGAALADVYPGCVQFGDVGLLGASDLAVWTYAADNGLVLVSKDEDLQQLAVLYGTSPESDLGQVGNCSTDDVIRLMRDRRAEIDAFLQHEDAAFLALA